MRNRENIWRHAGIILLGAVILFAALPAISQEKAKPKYDPSLLSGMLWRLIGPFRGGRSIASVGVPSDPNIYYMGAVGGGVWKSTNGGNTWLPLTDKWTVSSIGSIAVADSDANVVYVGTGEACIRGNVSHGDGVYKSLDGGHTQFSAGGSYSDHHAFAHDPSNPDILYDANDDGVIGVADAVMVLDYLYGSVPELPGAGTTCEI